MTGLTLAALLQASMIASANDYAAARNAMMESGRPLVILVGAEWCPACRTMKQSIMPQVAGSGHLKQVHYAEVNTDRQGALARSLMSGGAIPELIMYTYTESGWKRSGFVGAKSASEVQAFIDAGVKQATLAPINATRVVEKVEENSEKPGAKTVAASGGE